VLALARGKAVLPQWVPSSAVATCQAARRLLLDTLPFYLLALAPPSAGCQAGRKLTEQLNNEATD